MQAAIISGNPAVLAAILRTADTAEPPIVGAERHAATPRRNTRSQVAYSTLSPSRCKL